MSFYPISLSLGSVVMGVLSGYTLCKWRSTTSPIGRRYYTKLMVSYVATLVAFLWDLIIYILLNNPSMIWRLIPLCFMVVAIVLLSQAKVLRQFILEENAQKQGG